MRVLIIESDDAFASTLRVALQARGVEVVVTADGKAGVELAQAKPMAAVVLSVELGDRLTGGFTWCNKFKRDPALRSIPLLLTSSLATQETFEQHRKLKTRADDYLLKPYGPRELLDWLEPYLPQPPAPANESATVDLAGELLAGLVDDEAPIPEAEPTSDFGLWDDEPSASAGEAGDDDEPLFAGQAAADEEREEAALEVGASDLEGLDLLDTEDLIADIFDELGETPIEATSPEISAIPREPDPPWDEVAPRAKAVQDPPWAEPSSSGPSGGEGRIAELESALAALRAEAELLPELREDVRRLGENNERLGRELAAALERAKAAEQKLEEAASNWGKVRAALASTTALVDELSQSL